MLKKSLKREEYSKRKKSNREKMGQVFRARSKHFKIILIFPQLRRSQVHMART
jgi:hypothetical protein